MWSVRHSRLTRLLPPGTTAAKHCTVRTHSGHVRRLLPLALPRLCVVIVHAPLVVPLLLPHACCRRSSGRRRPPGSTALCRPVPAVGVSPWVARPVTGLPIPGRPVGWLVEAARVTTRPVAAIATVGRWGTIAAIATESSCSVTGAAATVGGAKARAGLCTSSNSSMASGEIQHKKAAPAGIYELSQCCGMQF